MEKVICSAIKFHRLDDMDAWCIYTGKRHCDALRRMYLDNIKYDKPTAIEGFITNRDRFVSRYEAAVIAKAANQIISDDFNGTCLYSEDVW